MQYQLEENQSKGVRIIAGQEAKQRRLILNQMIAIAEANGFDEITIPSVEPAKVYEQKAGAEILDQMYVFQDKGNRTLCLRPEGTATIQLVADKYFRTQKNVKFWYFERCWRYERPQTGRYREFFQFGLEVINPSDLEATKQELMIVAMQMVNLVTDEAELVESVKRGLNYYVADGFEISIPSLGAQKQVVGGGAYKQGVGFAVGFDRLMLQISKDVSNLKLPTNDAKLVLSNTIT